jgi:hypothetical protein
MAFLLSLPVKGHARKAREARLPWNYENAHGRHASVVGVVEPLMTPSWK